VLLYEHSILNFSGLDHDEIRKCLQHHNLALSPEDALTIQNDILKRSPTLAECVLWSIQGSEHCSYKSTRKYLETMVTDGPNVILGPKEDAGIVAVAKDKQGRRYGIVVSHESHNHPSQLVPYEGAATGVGGNLRDVCCMGAEVIALADSLRFGDIHRQKTQLIYEGVVAGISGYGNSVGVPNVAGDVYFDEAYNDNCLVTVVTLGQVREDQVIHSFAPKNADNYVYILVGKGTDNSGFGGASFASASLEEENASANKGAVQEPDAFLKRHLLKANYALFTRLQEMGLIDKVGFKDLGAGGIACATVELADASGYGAEVHLEKIPVSMNDLPPYVVLCSETQERFMWVVPPEAVELILHHYNERFALPDMASQAKAAVIGKIRTDGRYVVTYQGTTLVDAEARDITRGIRYDRPLQPVQKNLSEPTILAEDANPLLLKLLSHQNIASRAPVLERYDKQVQGRTLMEAGEADAGLLMPFNEEKFPEEIRFTGIALSLDQNPRYNKIDAYWGAVNAVVESARNVAATGATPQAITDCLCFGNPENPQHLWEFSESIRGIVDACRAIGLPGEAGASLPIISGNVSLYNESNNQAIPPSPMIACLGSMPDARKACPAHFQRAGSHLILLGERRDECGGSVYYQLHHQLGANVPKPNLATLGAEIQAVTNAIQQGLVLSAHDISEGGIAVTLAEMSFKNPIGVDVHLPFELPTPTLLFGESGGFILEIDESSYQAVTALLAQHHTPFWIIGKTTANPTLKMQNNVHLSIHDAKVAWENGLREKLL
jgi:phosphoribosylformylglycinamidine synthase